MRIHDNIEATFEAEYIETGRTVEYIESYMKNKKSNTHLKQHKRILRQNIGSSYDTRLCIWLFRVENVKKNIERAEGEHDIFYIFHTKEPNTQTRVIRRTNILTKKKSIT